MDEAAWRDLLRQFPHCVKTLSAYADWLQENGDPRWEPYLLLIDRYKNGFPTKGAWYEAAKLYLRVVTPPITTPLIREKFVMSWIINPGHRKAYEESIR
jgi:uncharacterized protein (TIGR02996 family)